MQNYTGIRDLFTPDLNTFQFPINPSYIFVQCLAMLDGLAMVPVHSSAPVLPLEKGSLDHGERKLFHSSLQAFHRLATVDTLRRARRCLRTPKVQKSIRAQSGDFTGI